MPILLLMFLLIACSPIQWPGPKWKTSIPITLLLNGVILILWIIFLYSISYRIRLLLIKYPERIRSTVRKYQNWRSILSFMSMILFALMLLVSGWGWAIQNSCVLPFDTTSEMEEAILFPGGELLIILPYFMILGSSWLIFYDCEKSIVSRGEMVNQFWSRSGYFFFRFRQFLVLVMLPVGMMIFQEGLFRIAPHLRDAWWVQLGSLLSVPILLIFLPSFLPFVLGLRPLETPEIRSRLETIAHRFGLSYRNFYLWPTHGSIANAMVVGIIPRYRFVVFTDRLIENLNPDEIDAVLGHEIGHVRHGHLIYYALFLLLSVLVISSLYEFLNQYWGLSSTENPLLEIAPIMIMGVYLFIIFGFLSRGCERQADLYGCRANSETGHLYSSTSAAISSSSVESLIKALLQVEELNGMRFHSAVPSRSLRQKIIYRFRSIMHWLSAWQHSTIHNRVRYLERVIVQPHEADRFQKRFFLFKLGLLLFLLGSLVGIGFTLGWKTILRLV